MRVCGEKRKRSIGITFILRQMKSHTTKKLSLWIQLQQQPATSAVRAVSALQKSCGEFMPQRFEKFICQELQPPHRRRIGNKNSECKFIGRRDATFFCFGGC